jgi:hypothetical protein
MKTQQKDFDIKYHHIEAPTFEDKELSKKLGKRSLINPAARPDAEKIYREPELEYLAKNPWTYKRKLNGENMRVLWDGDQAIWNGRTNSFTPNHETTEYMNSTFAEEIFEEKFGRDKQVLLFGERMAPGAQGNELKLESTEFVLFDVKIANTWLEPNGIRAIAEYFGLHSCYNFMRPIDEERNYTETLENLIELCSVGDFSEWEGIVAIPATGVFNRKGERIICKIKNQDYFVDLGSEL